MKIFSNKYILTLLVVFFVMAGALFKSVGGTISSTFGNASCAGTGPITINPYNLAPPSSYYLAPGVGVPPTVSGVQFLGLYLSSPIVGPCWSGPMPYPVLPFIIFGAAKSPLKI